MSRLYNTFEFVGNIFIPNDKDKFHDVRTSDSGWEGHRLNFSVKQSKSNSVFLELYGGFNKAKANKVFSFSKGTENEKGTKLEIPWDDRLSEETLNMVADFKKIVVDYTTDSELKDKIGKLRYEIRTLEYQDELSDDDKSKLKEKREELKELAVDRNEFVSEYDAVNFLSSTLEDHKNKKFRVTGSIGYQEHKGRFFRKFNPELIEIVDEDTPNQLRATMDIFFTKDSLDDKDFKKDKKVYINGYVLSYDSKAKKDQFFPQQLVINAEKIDFENETHVKRFEYLKNKFNVKGKGVYHLQWLVNIFRGADEVEFTFDDLTADQKEAVELGLNELDDFKPKGGTFGENVEENRLVKPLLVEVNKQNDFREGAIESTYDVEDLTFVATETNGGSSKKEEKKNDKPKVDVDKELDDLFG